MPNRKNRKGQASAKAKAFADARNVEALEIALTFVEQMYNGSKAIAIHNIDLLVRHLSAYWPPAMLMGHSTDHLSLAVRVLQQIKDCLNLVDGPLAVRATGAYEQLWHCKLQDECVGQRQFLRDVGFDKMFTTCVQSIQDAIGTAMIREPGAFQQVVDNDGFSNNTRSKLRHSYFIMKRQLFAVGQHIEKLGQENDAEHGPIRPPSP
jgi:hypothetical protein